MTGFTPALSLSNITTLAADQVVTSSLSVGDASQNLYLGSNAGNIPGNNVGSTAIGAFAASGLLNSSNIIAIGRASMQGCVDSSGIIAVGVDSVVNGTNSIYVGSGIRATGANNIVVGTDISLGSGISNQIRIGSLVSGDQGDQTLVVTGKLGVQRIPQRSFEVLGDSYATDGYVTGAGTISRPAFRFELDNSTGLYWPGSNQFGFSVLGVNRLLFSNSNITFTGDANFTGSLSAGSVNIPFIAPTNLAVPGYIRDVSTNPRIDISQTNIRIDGSLNVGGTIYGSRAVVSGALSAGSFAVASLDVSTLVANVAIRDRLTPSNLDISGGNISNSGVTRSLRFSASNGTVSQPSYSFLNDASTGVYLQATNELAMTTRGVKRFQMVDSSATVFGDLIVTGKLTAASGGGGGVVGGIIDVSGVTFSQFIRDNSTNPVLYDISGGNISNSVTTRSSNFVTHTASSNRIGGVLLSNSNVRINAGSITAPSLSFGSDPSTGLYVGVGPSISVNGVRSAEFASNYIAFSNLGATAALFINSQIQVPTAALPSSIPAYTFTTDTSTGMYRAGSASLGFTTGGNARMVITSTGNVGIATTSPSYPLDVSGTFQSCNAIVGGYVRNALTPSQFDISGGNIFLSNRILTGAGTASAPSHTFSADLSMGLYDPATNVLGFVTAGVERMRIASNGNVGIGTGGNTPSTSLAVVGDVSASGILTAGVRVVASNISANQTLSRADLASFFLYTTTAAYDVTLPTVANASNGWNVLVRNMPASTANLTVKLSDTTTLTTVAPGVSTTVVCDGTNMYAV
jgi:hypothetical protein